MSPSSRARSKRTRRSSTSFASSPPLTKTSPLRSERRAAEPDALTTEQRPQATRLRGHHPWAYIKAFYFKAYEDNLTGLSGMVAYTMLLSLLPLALLAPAPVAIPPAQSILLSGAHGLPFGLGHLKGLVYALTLVAGLIVLFGMLTVIYWTVPNRLVPWRAIWPGALAATVAIGTIDYAFPLYLSNISTIARF